MENQPENKTEHVKIEKHLMDRKKFKRTYRSMFDSYANRLCLAKYPEDQSRYSMTWRKIMTHSQSTQLFTDPARVKPRI